MRSSITIGDATDMIGANSKFSGNVSLEFFSRKRPPFYLLNLAIRKFCASVFFTMRNQPSPVGMAHILSMRAPLKIFESVVRLVSVLMIDAAKATWVGNEGQGEQPVHIIFDRLSIQEKADHKISNLVLSGVKHSPFSVFIGTNFARFINLIDGIDARNFMPVHWPTLTRNTQ